MCTVCNACVVPESLKAEFEGQLQKNILCCIFHLSSDHKDGGMVCMVLAWRASVLIGGLIENDMWQLRSVLLNCEYIQT